MRQRREANKMKIVCNWVFFLVGHLKYVDIRGRFVFHAWQISCLLWCNFRCLCERDTWIPSPLHSSHSRALETAASLTYARIKNVWDGRPTTYSLQLELTPSQPTLLILDPFLFLLYAFCCVSKSLRLYITIFKCAM